MGGRYRGVLVGIGALLTITGCFPKTSVFLSRDRVSRAENCLSLCLRHYREAVLKNPSDAEIAARYRTLLQVSIGRIPAEIETALLYREAGRDADADLILTDVTVSGREEAAAYLRRKMETVRGARERIAVLEVARVMSPRDPWIWEQEGRAYLDSGARDKAIPFLETAYTLGARDPRLRFLLARTFWRAGNAEKAKFYAGCGLGGECDSPKLRDLLLQIERREKQRELARSRKEGLLVFRRPARPTAQVALRAPVRSGFPRIAGVTSAPISVVSPYTFLVVSKQNQSLSVWEFDGRSLKVLGEYACTTGQNHGPKESAGDLKTPVGAYRLVSKIDGPRLPEKYGIAAFPLDFPNCIDRRLRRTGNGIWLHGTPIERPPYNSEGCIVLNNTDLGNLMPAIKSGETFVVISDRMEPSAEGFEELAAEVREWAGSWESLDIDRYLSHYDESFFSQGKDRKSWGEYKRRVARDKSFIRVGISNLRLFPYGDTPFGEMALAVFSQDYSSSTFRSRSEKALFLVKRNKGWKILAEELL